TTVAMNRQQQNARPAGAAAPVVASAPNVAATPAPPPQVAAPAAESAADPSKQARLQAEAEERFYSSARGNAASLQAYLSSCRICSLDAAARTEVARLEASEQEERPYVSAHGNLLALRAYVNTCKTCAFDAAARAEITELEQAEHRSRAASAALCGRSVDYLVDRTGAPDASRPFL